MEGFDANPEHACGHILIPAHHSQGLIWLLFQSAIVCYPEELATLIWMHSVVSHTCVCRRLGGVLPDIEPVQQAVWGYGGKKASHGGSGIPLITTVEPC
jgi:hypothetical protein